MVEDNEDDNQFNGEQLVTGPMYGTFDQSAFWQGNNSLLAKNQNEGYAMKENFNTLNMA